MNSEYLHIFARNCEVKRIDKVSAEGFLNRYHRLGHTACKYYYGLYSINGLVAVGGFSKARRWQKGENVISSYEWVRYASIEGTRVLGGMGKILKCFIREVQPDDIMSYADASWSDGDVYKKLGFKEEETKTFAKGAESIKFRLKLTDYE